MWCLPGGMIDPGECVAEGCTREVLEETGMRVWVLRLTGVYSDPDQLVVYPDGNQALIVALIFTVETEGGELVLSDETTDIRFFPIAEALTMDLFHSHAQRIREALLDREVAFIHRSTRTWIGGQQPVS